MKKQESGNKKAKWLIPVLALVLVAIVGVAAFLAFGGGDSQGETPVTTPTVPAADEGLVLYWNVDRMGYVGQGMDNNSSRMPRSDGFYYIRFAVNGEQIDLPVRDKTLVNRIDMVDIMTLILDEEGVVVDMQTVNECAGGLVAPALYVESMEGNIVHTKTNGNFGGLAVDLEITEDVKIFDVGGVGLLVGIPGQIEVDDELIAVRDKDGKVIYVFVKSYEPPADVYWNIHRKYNTTTKQTTREPSVVGVYEFLMACNGELVTVRTRDYEVANKMDSYASKYQHLEFSEDGYVISCSQSSSMLKTSGTWASWAHVLTVDGKHVIAEKLSGDKMGTVYDDYITDDTKIIDVSAAGGYSGAYTELRVGDQVHGLFDRRGRLSHIFVHNRLVDCGLYWNCERKYDTTNKVTTRVPDAQGYYWFDVATGGKQIRVRTNDREIANSVDSYAARCFGLELDGQDIVKVYGAGTIHGGSTFGSWYYVDKIDGKKITVKRILTGDTVPTYMEGVLADDVEIVNGSTNYSSHCGEYSKLSVGDRVHGLKNLKGEIRVLFIVEKPVDSPVYWNLVRMYNSTTKQTTRVPDEDGYYVFKMACDGKQVKLKTKDKALATKIDANAACCWGLTVYNGIIYKAHGVSSVRGLSGGTKSMSWVDVTRVSGGSFTATKKQAGHKDDGKIFTSTIGWGCKIINVTAGTKSHMGEYTDLRVGDRVHVLHDGDGFAKYIFVVGNRNKELSTEREDCPCTQNPAWEPWDGTTDLKDGKFYYLTADVQTPAEGLLIEGMTVALRLDGHTISSEGRCFFVKSGGQLSICDHTGGGKLVGTGVTGESGGVIRMYTNAGEAYVKLWNLELTADDTDANTANQGGIISASGSIDLYNCNVHGGTSSSTGGGMHINQTGVLRMFDTTVTGGTATGNGGNVHINTGSFYFENVTLSNGQAGGKGDNMNISSDKQMKINGLTLTHSGKNANGLNFSSGTVGIAGNVQIHESGKDNVTMANGAVFVNEGLDPASKLVVKAGEQVILTDADEATAACIESYDAADYITVYDKDTKEVSFKCIIEPKTHDFEHCICAGLGYIGDHECQDEFGWIEINDSVFEEVVGTNDKVQGVKFKESGNYYLTLDYITSRQICIMPDQTINICLNGNDLSRASGTLFMVAGKLNVTDCCAAGTASGAETGNGGTVKVVSGGTFNLFGGTLTCDVKTGTGAVVNVTQDKGYIADPADTRPGVFNMYGGTLTGGQADNGGNVNVWHSAHFNMYGGTISDGSATAKGGNISVAGAGCEVKLLGGTITGGSSAQGGGIYTNRNITIGADMKIYGNTGADIFLDGNTVMIFDGYTPTEIMTVGKATPGVFADSATDLSAWFESANPDLAVTYKAGQLKLGLSSSAQGHIHCECGDSAKGMYAHECENALFEPWSETDSLPKAGYYYLTEDVTLPATHKVGANTLVICLNGHTISCQSSRLFHMDNSASCLTVTDCQGKGALQATGIADGSGGGVIRNGYSTSKVSLYNLTITRIDDPANRVKVQEGGLISCSGYLNLYNVTATNGYANKGGGILVALTAKVVIVNSTISGCEGVGNNGGNIFVGGNNTGNKATVTLIDTTVTGGKGTSATGNDIFLGSGDKNEMFVGGKITVGDLNMAGNGNLNVLDMGLDAQSSIGISMASTGKIGVSDTDVSACFKPMDSNLEVSYSDGALSMRKPSVAHPAHCICGGKTVGVGDHVCENVTGWTEISADVFTTAMGTNDKSQGVMFIEDGNYYLNDNFTLSGTLCIMPGQQITICLNGYTLSRTGGKAIMCAGALNITDCQTNGTIKSSVNNDNSATMKIVKGGHVAMFGGTLTNSGTRTSTFGGIVGVSKDSGYITTSTEGSSFTMYGGTISGGKATEHGGNIVGWSAVNITIYGGTISGGEAGTHGGNIAYSGSGTLKILGGNIIGGKANEGAGISIKGGTFILGGNVNIQDGEVYLAQNKEIKINGLTNTNPIPVTMAIPGVFATGVNSDLSAQFCSTDLGYEVKYDAGMKVLSLLPKAVATTHDNHCICGGNAEGVGDHTNCAALAWTELNQLSFTTPDGENVTAGTYYTLKNGGVYYLSGDVVLDKPLGVAKGETATLCLNGNDLSASGCRVIELEGTLNLCDCRFEDVAGERAFAGTVKGTVNNSGATFHTLEGSAFNIYGGNLRGAIVTASSKTGATGLIYGTVNLYGGKIYGGTSTAHGGNLYIDKGATMTMYGGLITGGHSGSSNGGGNIRINNGNLLMHGGTISDGWGKEGGNVNIGANGRMEMYGGIIEKGTATNAGGNVTVFSTFIMKGDSVIRDGVVTDQTTYGGGGNIYGMQNKTNILIEGGTVSGGKAHQGSNVLLRTNTSTKIYFTMTGGSVSGVAAGSAGKSIEGLAGAIQYSLGGSAVIDEIKLNGQKLEIHADGFTAGAAIGLSMVTPGTFATIADDFDYTTVFTAVDGAYQVEQTATELKLTAK